MSELRNIDQSLSARIQTQIFLTFRSTVRIGVMKIKYKEIINKKKKKRKKKKKQLLSVDCVPGTGLYVSHSISHVTLIILLYLFY